LDLDVAGSSVRDKQKIVKSLALLLEESSRGFLLGPSAADLHAFRAERWQADALVTGQEEQTITAGFTNSGRVFIRHTEPLPLTVLGLMPRFEVGG
jgi:hypothetical protein